MRPVDALVARLADPEADPVLRRADAAGLRSRLGGPPPEQPGDYGAVLARVIADVLPFGARTDHPGYLAFIPELYHLADVCAAEGLWLHVDAAYGGFAATARTSRAGRRGSRRLGDARSA